MASLNPRVDEGGIAVGHQVKRHADGAWRTAAFPPEGEEAAAVSEAAAEGVGNRWPVGRAVA